MDTKIIEKIKREFSGISSDLNEQSRRLWAASEAMKLGYGGITAVSQATGIARDTIARGIKELKGTSIIEESPANNIRIRSKGGGRKKLSKVYPELMKTLESLVEPITRGVLESPLKWTCKSTYKLAEELANRGFPVSARSVGYLLLELGYRLQTSRKTLEGKHNPDRNLQFEHINQAVVDFQKESQPTISIDIKKKENIGNNADRILDKVIPDGACDTSHNEGWVSVGIEHDTVRFATGSILRWWTKMGKQRFPYAKKLLISADGGGSNGSLNLLWKAALQDLANTTGLELFIFHFPPGTSKWNKIEHRFYSYISQKSQDCSLLTNQSAVELIGNTCTQGVIIQTMLDENQYETKETVSDEEFNNFNITYDKFYGGWNYVIRPKQS